MISRYSQLDETGQSLAELAVILPFMLLILITIVDVGRVAMLAGGVSSAADMLAREIEGNPDMSGDEAKALVEKAYPQYSGSSDVTVTDLGNRNEQIDYYVYNPEENVFKNRNDTRPTEVAWHSYKVDVTYHGQWVSPGMMVFSKLSTGGNGFDLSAGAVAAVDTTLDEWVPNGGNQG